MAYHLDVPEHTVRIIAAADNFQVRDAARHEIMDGAQTAAGTSKDSRILLRNRQFDELS